MLGRTLLVLVSVLCACRASAGDCGSRELTVISYHEITDPKDALVPAYAVSSTMFVRHVDRLRNNGFEFVGINQVIAASRGGRPLPEKAVLLPPSVIGSIFGMNFDLIPTSAQPWGFWAAVGMMVLSAVVPWWAF
ncbi:MAG: CorA family divalent cation transporter, partial [Gammaproteobacteria bacterium]